MIGPQIIKTQSKGRWSRNDVEIQLAKTEKTRSIFTWSRRKWILLLFLVRVCFYCSLRRGWGAFFVKIRFLKKDRSADNQNAIQRSMQAKWRRNSATKTEKTGSIFTWRRRRWFLLIFLVSVCFYYSLRRGWGAFFGKIRFLKKDRSAGNQGAVVRSMQAKWRRI